MKQHVRDRREKERYGEREGEILHEREGEIPRKRGGRGQHIFIMNCMKLYEIK